MTKSFPISIIVATILLSALSIGFELRGVVLEDVIAAGVGRTLGWLLMVFAVYALFYKSGGGVIDAERVRKSTQAAWIALVVVAVTSATRIF